MRTALARPVKTTGRVVLGPRIVGEKYARIVALVDGSGLIQIYDEATRAWCDAGDLCTFYELWSANPAPLTFAISA